MKQLRKMICSFLAVAVIGGMSTIPVFAAGEEGWSSGGIMLSVSARFVSGTWYHGDASTNLITYKCYVHLQEGSYDSGRVYSKEGPKRYQPGGYISINKQKANKPFVASKANWGFEKSYPI